MMRPLGQPIATGRTAEIYDWEDGCVLKLHRDWCPPHLIEQEARITRLVQQAGIRTPNVGVIVEVNGRRGLVYERVDGPPLVEGLSRNLLKLVYYAHMLADLQAGMHTHTSAALPSQRAQIRRHIQDVAPTLPAGVTTRVLQALDRLPDGDRVCHGDFHPNNVLLTRGGPIIIDWESATQGSPCADVARTHLSLSAGEPAGPINPLVILLRGLFTSSYLRRYRSLAPGALDSLRAWLPIEAVVRLKNAGPRERERLLKIIASGLDGQHL